MDTIDTQTFFTNSDTTELVLQLLSIIITIFIFIRTPKYNLVKERYVKIIFPLFNLLEPYLFAPYDSDIIKSVSVLIKSQPAYAGSRILECMYYLELSPSQKNFDSLCAQVNHDYDKCCFFLGLKNRSFMYRTHRRQYKNKNLFCIYLLFNALLFFVCICICTFALFSFIQLFK